MGKITPTGFLPEEDQGAIFTVVQLPDGASVERTRAVVRAGGEPDPADAAGRGGAVDRRVFAAGWRQPAERGVPGDATEAVPGPRRAQRTACARCWARSSARRSRSVRRSSSRSTCRRSSACPPAAASNTSWRTWKAAPPEDMASVMQGMVAAANQDPRLNRVFSTFTASNPSIWLDIDREKAQALGLVDLRRVQRAADHLGRLLRQRFQPVRPHLAGQHPGRRDRPQRSGGDLQDLYPQQERRDGAAALDRQCPHRSSVPR